MSHQTNRTHEETAITLEQYRQIMATRTRPLTDDYISNTGATNVRTQQSLIASSPTDNVIDVVQRLVDARRARQKAS